MIGLSFLANAAKYGRFVLVAGLLAGIGLPDLANVIRAVLPELVALLLFTNAFRIGAKNAFSGLHSFRDSLGVAVILQVFVPCAFIAVFSLFGFTGPLVTAIIIMSAASAISGSPNLVQLSGNDPAPALRLLVTGTALLPMTTLIVLYFYPDLGSYEVILWVALKLALVIVLAAGLGFLIRASLFPDMPENQIEAVDGFSVILMAVLVVGLMSELGPALVETPLHAMGVLLAAFAVNFGLQIITFVTMSNDRFRSERVAYSVAAGNRNMALFLTALPASLIDPILLFIACYQIPMYVTPLAFKWLYKHQ